MVFLRALISTARMICNTPKLAAGLTPDDDVLLDAPDQRLAPVLAAAGRGDHRPAAALLAATREAAEWESRDRYATRLAVFAQSRSHWFTRWLTQSPRDPDAALVEAELAVRTAWGRPGRAESLRETAPLIDAAARRAPGDPVPWRIALDHARGTHAPRTRADALWEEAVGRSPHHYGCHVAALRYRASHCSYGECFDFAERSAADALPDSLLQALPVRAAYGVLLEQATEVNGGVPLEVAERRVAELGVEDIDEWRIDAATDRAIGLSARYGPADPWPAEVRNLLVCVLIVRRRWAQALEEFRRIGPYATAFPWDRLSDDPLGQFLELRDGVRIQLASTMPLRRRTAGGPRNGSPGGH